MEREKASRRDAEGAEERRIRERYLWALDKERVFARPVSRPRCPGSAQMGLLGFGEIFLGLGLNMYGAVPISYRC